jgi:nitrate/TMAO reductase-like tetraheme cytochrome c subunit
MKSIYSIFTVLLLAAATSSHALDNRERAAVESAACLGCHDLGPNSKVHALLAGSHGLAGDNEAMAGRHGCADCHGASTAHIAAPSRVSPDVSFGPRWTASPAAQDLQCLACHEQDTARNWRHALHMLNNLTCVTCHDLLTWEDKVLFEEHQADVCTTCHKAQKQGIHGMQEIIDRNPPCSVCHNPHDHESAENEMLQNDSAGCRTCHDPRMLENFYEPPKGASSFHQMTQQADRTCLDCHQGIAHAAADSVTAMVTQAVSSKEITLFYPGTADSDWLQKSHPGSQAMRQGRNCQQCHRGEEAAMGEVQAAGRGIAFRNIQIAFTVEGDHLLLSLQWQGPKDESSISLMWGNHENEVLRNSGCFAACHSDMAGMTQDRAQQLGKYLSASRVQPQLPGETAVIKDTQALEEMIAQGEFADLWRIQLQSSTVEQSMVLAETRWEQATSISVEKHYRDGQWNVTIRCKLNDAGSRTVFTEQGKYTFGVALNGATTRGSSHWVSLPMTFNVDGDETDFKAR